MAYDAELPDRIRRAVGTRRDLTKKRIFGGRALQ